jgi:hypothetical protein
MHTPAAMPPHQQATPPARQRRSHPYVYAISLTANPPGSLSDADVGAKAYASGPNRSSPDSVDKIKGRIKLDLTQERDPLILSRTPVCSARLDGCSGHSPKAQQHPRATGATHHRAKREGSVGIGRTATRRMRRQRCLHPHTCPRGGRAANATPATGWENHQSGDRPTVSRPKAQNRSEYTAPASSSHLTSTTPLNCMVAPSRL